MCVLFGRNCGSTSKPTESGGHIFIENPVIPEEQQHNGRDNKKAGTTSLFF